MIIDNILEHSKNAYVPIDFTQDYWNKVVDLTTHLFDHFDLTDSKYASLAELASSVHFTVHGRNRIAEVRFNFDCLVKTFSNVLDHVLFLFEMLMEVEE